MSTACRRTSRRASSGRIPANRDLLYAGTQSGAFVSFDRGGHWQPLQLNLPRVPVNDITVHDRDLVIATWGRGLWILDDVSPLRQIAAVRADTAPAFLFTPSPATRVRWSNNQDTPLPPEVPAGENPPDGAILDYYLRAPAAGVVTMTILDDTGAPVREFSSVAAPPDTRMPNVPAYWFREPLALPATAGMHRIAWDLRYPTPPALDFGPGGEASDVVSFGIIAPAVIGQSPKQQPLGPLVLPGTYQVRLAVNGRWYSRELRVANDPRSTATSQDLAAQLAVERGLTGGMVRAREAIEQIRKAGSGAGPVITALAGAGRALGSRVADLDFADLRPTASTVAAVQESCARLDAALDRYRQFVASSMPGAAPIGGPACAPDVSFTRR